MSMQVCMTGFGQKREKLNLSHCVLKVRNILEVEYTPYKRLILNNNFDNSVFHGHNQSCQQNYINISNEMALSRSYLINVNLIVWFKKKKRKEKKK